MGDIKPHPPVLLLLAAFSRREAGLDWARRRAADAWGPVALASDPFLFTQTRYYEPAMGPGLKKIFFAFERLIDPARLVDIKHQTNRWEQQYREVSDWPEPRPLNLDPGYLTEAKLVLASTKDRDHRLYLDRGIFAEGTLYYHQGAWRTREWTYPDYRDDRYHQFFIRCRNYLRRQDHGRYRQDLAGSPSPAGPDPDP